MKAALILSLSLSFGLALAAQPSWSMDQIDTTNNCNDSDLLLIKKSKTEDPATIARIRSRQMPAPNPRLLEGWEFLGLTKQEIIDKIAQINSCTRTPNAKFWKFVEPNKIIGFSTEYSVHFDEDKAVRIVIYPLFGSSGEIDDRKKALTKSILRLTDYIESFHRVESKLEMIHRSKYAVICHYGLLRDKYAKRASLLKETGQDSSSDEYSAKKYDEVFDNLLSKVSAKKANNILNIDFPLIPSL